MEQETFSLYNFLFTHPIFNLYNLGVIAIGGGISYWFYQEYKRTKSRPLLTSLPGIFTSLGLLGTFLSIVISLSGIKADDFSMNDDSTIEINTGNLGHSSSEITEDAIDAENGAIKAGIVKTKAPSGIDKTLDIISGLVPAFTSSILGLIMAFIATVLTKRRFAKEDALIDGKTNDVTPEESLYNIYQLLDRQKDQTEEYNRQLKGNIEEQNEILRKYLQGFEEKMGTIFDTMKTQITSQVESIGTEQLGRAEGILNRISESLADVTKDLLDAQKLSVQGLVDATDKQLKDMATSVASQYELIQQNANANVAVMTALKEQYAKANSDMLDEAMSMNELATEEMRKSLKGFVDNISESVSTECQQLHSSIEANVKALQKAYTFIEDRITQITADYDQASLAYRDAVKVAHRQNESTEKAIKKANESLSMLKETNEQIGDLLDAFTERQDNIETLVSHINEIGSAIESLQKLESQLKRLSK